MFINNILAAGALLSLASAVPLNQHEKRDVVWTTHVVEKVVTVPVTTTMMIKPGEHLQHGHGHGAQRTSHVYQTITVQPVPAPPGINKPATPPAAPPAAPPSPQQQPPAPAPAPPSPAPQQPSPEPQQQPPAPQPHQPAPQPEPPAPSQPSGGSPPSGNKYSGDITYYTPGLGSCGKTNTESDMIVALAEGMMMADDNGNPNTNPNCGKSITISYGGKTAQATIEDTCPGCADAALDLTPTLFAKFAPLSEGRVSGVQWWFN